MARSAQPASDEADQAPWNPCCRSISGSPLRSPSSPRRPGSRPGSHIAKVPQAVSAPGLRWRSGGHGRARPRRARGTSSSKPTQAGDAATSTRARWRSCAAAGCPPARSPARGQSCRSSMGWAPGRQRPRAGAGCQENLDPLDLAKDASLEVGRHGAPVGDTQHVEPLALASVQRIVVRDALGHEHAADPVGMLDPFRDERLPLAREPSLVLVLGAWRHHHRADPRLAALVG